MQRRSYEMHGTGPESRDEIKRYFLDIARISGLSSEAAKEMIAGYDAQGIKKAEGDGDALALKYGLKKEDFTADEYNRFLSFLFAAEVSRNDKNQREFVQKLEQIMHEGLVRRSLQKIDAILADIESGREITELKDTLTQFFESLIALSRQIPPENKENAAYWDNLISRYKNMTARRGALDKRVDTVYEEVFDRFSGFIEDELVEKERLRAHERGQGVSMEKLVNILYGRSPEEVEEIKIKNRERVAAEIERMNEEPYITPDMLIRLYAVNNSGIIPKSLSRVRKEDEIIFFGKRIGTFPEDVQVEVGALLERANRLIDQNALGEIFETMYEAAAAKLHNDFLEIHPFVDRNGSTALLFLELLMARRGYKPSPKREKNYYEQVRKIFGLNPLAIGMVAFLHFRISFIPGYYKGRESWRDERKNYYEMALMYVKKITGRGDRPAEAAA